MNTSAPPSAPFLCFLVCTFHREDLLERCIRSILSQNDVAAVNCEIVVVDNSDAGTAASVVSQIAAQAQVPVRYVQAHPANIAVARNAGVQSTRAQFIAMIDDDMVVSTDWLVHAKEALDTLPYDVFSGPVYPVYEDPALASPESDAFFHRHMDVTGPTPLRIMGEQRTRSYIPATSNSIFRRERCLVSNPVFDERYGKSGGEDVDFFCRLESMGRTFAWLPKIKTQELVPVRRCDFAYLEKRSFVGGQIFASTYIRNSGSPALTSLKVTAIAAAQIAALAPLKVLAGLLPKRKARAIRLRFAAVRGKLAWRIMMPIYAQQNPVH